MLWNINKSKKFHLVISKNVRNNLNRREKKTFKGFNTFSKNMKLEILWLHCFVALNLRVKNYRINKFLKSIHINVFGMLISKRKLFNKIVTQILALKGLPVLSDRKFIMPLSSGRFCLLTFFQKYLTLSLTEGGPRRPPP